MVLLVLTRMVHDHYRIRGYGHFVLRVLKRGHPPRVPECFWFHVELQVDAGTFKNDDWQPYASLVAAAYARAMIETLPDEWFP